VSCYAKGYDDNAMDFDKAVDYWVRARAAGTLVAWDNIRTHYETGMNGAREDGIDVDKALHYYRAGANRHCAKCELNVGVAYEDRMGENESGLKGDSECAEKYYNRAVSLADDSSDMSAQTRTRKDLAALCITRSKLAARDSADAEQWRKRPNR
jgi:hypothetical protein